MGMRPVRVSAFDILNTAFMVLLCASTIYPFLYLASLSLQERTIFSLSVLSLIPRQPTLRNYAQVVTNQYIVAGFASSLRRVLVGTPLNVLFLLLTAYPLSKRHFPNRSLWTGLLVFTMFFSGGLVPTYLLVKSLGLLDRFWVLVLPGLIGTYSMLIVRNYLMTIPDSLEESAKMDGANDFTILFRIVLPMATPVIATVALWAAVGHWNAWFDSLIYITTPLKHVLQVVLRRIVLQGTTQELETMGSQAQAAANPENLKAATILVTVLPIVLLYPFAQRYFVKGILIGSLKG